MTPVEATCNWRKKKTEYCLKLSMPVKRFEFNIGYRYRFIDI